MEEIERHKKAIALLLDYFDYIPEEEKQKVNRELKRLRF